MASNCPVLWQTFATASVTCNSHLEPDDFSLPSARARINPGFWQDCRDLGSRCFQAKLSVTGQNISGGQGSKVLTGKPDKTTGAKLTGVPGHRDYVVEPCRDYVVEPCCDYVVEPCRAGVPRRKGVSLPSADADREWSRVQTA